MIRDAREKDAVAIAAIYNHYVLTSVATFEEDEVSESTIVERMQKVGGLGLPWLVVEEDGRVHGYAYATQWITRSASRFTVELSIYVASESVGLGWGTRLLETLLARLREKGVHAAIGVLTLPNAASVALHEKCGLAKVGHLKEVGWKFDQWLDVGYWQIVFDE